LFYGSEARPGLKDVITVFNKKTDTINARTVTAPVLQALLGLEAAEAADLIAQRDENAADFVTALQTKVAAIDPTLQEKLVDEPAHTVMIEARADTAQPRNHPSARMCAVGGGGGDPRRAAAGAVARSRALDRQAADRSHPGEAVVTLGELSQRLRRADFVDGLGIYIGSHEVAFAHLSKRLFQV